MFPPARTEKLLLSIIGGGPCLAWGGPGWRARGQAPGLACWLPWPPPWLPPTGLRQPNGSGVLSGHGRRVFPAMVALPTDRRALGAGFRRRFWGHPSPLLGMHGAAGAMRGLGVRPSHRSGGPWHPLEWRGDLAGAALSLLVLAPLLGGMPCCSSHSVLRRPSQAVCSRPAVRARAWPGVYPCPSGWDSLGGVVVSCTRWRMSGCWAGCEVQARWLGASNCHAAVLFGCFARALGAFRAARFLCCLPITVEVGRSVAPLSAVPLPGCARRAHSPC